MGEHRRANESGNQRRDEDPAPGRPTSRSSSSGDEPSLLVVFGRLAGVGWFVAGAIAGGTLGGVWLDGQFNTGPILTLIGLALGIVLAAGGLFRMLGAFGGRGTDR